MDHTTIDNDNLVERYLLGRLTIADRRRFEAHFVDCPRCLEQLEWAEDLHGALRTAAAEDAGTVLTGGILAFLARRGRGTRALLGLAALAVPVALTLALLLPQVRVLEQRAAQAEQAAAGVQDRRPEVNVATVLLGAVVRDGGSDREAASLEVRERQRVVLEIDSAAAFEGYRVRLLDSGGEQIWQDRLRPNPWALLEITFPAGFLEPGDYRLQLTGLEAGGRTVDLGSFALRAVAEKNAATVR